MNRSERERALIDYDIALELARRLKKEFALEDARRLEEYALEDDRRNALLDAKIHQAIKLLKDSTALAHPNTNERAR